LERIRTKCAATTRLGRRRTSLAADRNFILGTFLPTLLFAIVVLFLFRDEKPAKEWIEALAAKDIGQAALPSARRVGGCSCYFDAEPSPLPFSRRLYVSCLAC
jgi:hypothetical protein